MPANRKILVAEDDELARKILADMLSENDCDVIAVGNGEDALRILNGPDAPEVVLLDWMMPGMTGLEVVDRIRNNPNLSRTYVIFLTAKDTVGDIITSLNRGARDFVRKPFDPDELLARIRVAFRTVDLQRELADRVAQLEEAFRRISQLEGILPICSNCKKIRDAENRWSTIEEYVEDRAPVSFSHGFCPDCYRKLMSELDEEEK